MSGGEIRGSVPFSIVIPTYSEPGLPDLLRRIEAVCRERGLDAEVVVVDDTPEEVVLLPENLGLRSVVLRRALEGSAWGGLSGAVVDGIGAATNGIVVVMDGDGQHPPEKVPVLADMAGEFGLAIASRYTAAGGNDGLDGGMRRVVSNGSTLLARGLFPRRVGARTTDPMTGFFALDRRYIDIRKVARRATGFKILLAILVTHPYVPVAETPFIFQERSAGESKASLRNGLKFVGQLIDLRVSA